MTDSNFKNEIIQLILSKREGDYWDFKQCHHKNKANLLHDIICMANNRADRDAYIIFGVKDSTFEIVGIENDPNRKNQQQIIDQLKNKKFIGGIRPTIELLTFTINKHYIDVLVIKNTTDTPYYLTEDFRHENRLVRSNYIYTRVCDTNTDINKSADINHVEYLWKKRFLLNRPPLEQVIERLKNREEWKQEEDTYYNIMNPEFTITIEDDDRNLSPEFYAYSMCNESVCYHELIISYHGTKLYTDQLVTLDGGRYTVPTPKWEYFRFGDYKVNADYTFKYFSKEDIKFKLLDFLFDKENHEQVTAYQNLCEVILVFDNLFEKEQFMKYVFTNRNKLDKLIAENETLYEWIEPYNELARKVIVERLKIGFALNTILKEYRKSPIFSE